MKRIMFVIGVLVAMAGNVQAGSVTCTEIGSSVFCSDGSSSNTIGNTTFYNNGDSQTRIGGTTIYNEQNTRRNPYAETPALQPYVAPQYNNPYVPKPVVPQTLEPFRMKKMY